MHYRPVLFSKFGAFSMCFVPWFQWTISEKESIQYQNNTNWRKSFCFCKCFLYFQESSTNWKIASGRIELVTKCSELKNCWRGESNSWLFRTFRSSERKNSRWEFVGRAQQQPGVCGSCLATDQVGVKHLPGCTCVSLRVWHAPTRLGRPFFFFLYFFPIFYFVVLVLGI
jgi:hypothetical protein